MAFPILRPLVFLMPLLACLAAPRPAAAFDAERAMELVRRQCRFGPRVPGTPAHDQCRQWIVDELKTLGWTVREETFEVRLPLNGQTVKATNIWATLAADGPTSPAIMLSAHWDTRPWADRDASRTHPPLDGANDGASGVAVLLEMARTLAGDPLRTHLVLAFWDVEDAGIQSDLRSWALGSRHAAQNPPEWIGRVVLGINFDMVGGHDLNLRREYYSLLSAPRAVAAIWRLGRALAPARFNNDEPFQLVDDHLPWIEFQKLPYVDLVGFPYEHWHTAGDSPDNVSPAALQAVGDVALEYLRRNSWRTDGR